MASICLGVEDLKGQKCKHWSYKASVATMADEPDDPVWFRQWVNQNIAQFSQPMYLSVIYWLQST